MPNPRLRFEPEFRMFRPLICGCFTGGVHVFFRPRSKVGWPKSDFGCQSFEIRKSRFRGTGEKISGKIGLPEAAVCRGREKTLEINGTPMFVFPVSAKDCMIGAYLGVHTLRN